MSTPGVNLRLNLDGAAQVGAGLGDTTTKVNQLGISAKQTAAAMRGVPAQFTDIFTSISAGQSPMQVMLQQGGQLKDMFGGIGPAAKALSGYVLGLINPFTLAAAAGGALAYAYYQGSQEADAYNRATVMTGNAVGKTTGQLQDMARTMASTRGTQADAAASLAAMASTGRVAGEDLMKFSAIAVDMERTVGQSVGDTAKAFADLAQEPVKASLKLNESLGYLTTATYAQIKAAVALGDEERAAALAQNAYAEAMKTRTAQMEGNLGTIERGWKSVKSAASSAWDAMLGVGRQSSLAGKLAEVTGQIAQRQGQDKNRPTALPWEESLASLQQRQASLQEMLRLEKRGAEAAGERAAANRAGVAAVGLVTTANTKAATKTEQMNKALGDYRRAIADIRAADPNSALLDPKKIADAEEGIRRQYKETKAAKTAAQVETEKEAALMAKLSGVNADYQEQLTRLGVLRTKNNMSQERYVDLVKQLIAEQPAAKKQMEDEAKAVNALVEARQNARIKEDAGIAAFLAAQQEAAHKSLQTIADRVQGLQDEAAAVQISREKNVSLAVAVEMVAIARLKEEQARKFVPGYEGWEAIQREIDKRQELLGLMNTKDVREKEQAGWTSMWNSLDSTAHATFTNVLEGGQGIWTKLRNTAKSVFFDWLYQMTLKKWLFNVTVSASGGSLSSAAGAATGGGSLFSSAGTAASLYNTLSTGYAGAVGSGVSSLFGTTAGNAAMGTALTGSASSAAAAAQAAAVAGGAAETTAAAAASLGSSLGALAAAAPWIAAFVGAAYVLDKYVVSQATIHQGGGSQYSAAAGLQTTGVWTPESVSEGYWQGDANGNQTWVADRKTTPGYMSGSSDSFAGGFTNVGYSEQAIALTTGITKGIVGLLDSTAVAFGKSAGYQAATSFADDTSKDGAWGSLLISKMGDTLVNWQASESFRTFGDGAAGSAEYQAAIAADVRQVLNKIDLPAWATDMLAAIGDTPDLTTLGAAVAQINLAKTALVTMGEKLVGFAAMSDSAVSALVKASGGMEALTANAASYYENFYSQGERSTFTLTEIAKTLNAVNLNLPTTREGFRALVEQQQALGNGEAVAALWKVQDSFASVIPAAETMAEVVNDLAQSMSDATASVNDEISRLRGDLVKDSPAAQAYLTAQFTTTTAQARAGDVAAMAALPKISQALESAAIKNAMSALDIARTRAWLANSLSDTYSAAGGVAPGSVYATAPGATSSTSAVTSASSPNARLETLVEKLTAKVDALITEAKATVSNTADTNRSIQRVTPGGDAIEVRIVV